MFLSAVVVGTGLFLVPVQPHEDSQDTSSPPVAALGVTGDWEVQGLLDYDFSGANATRWKLPEDLDEISGLALTADGRLLAHNDEQGIVFELDPWQKAVVKRFELSDLGGAVRDDFEGIAVSEERIYLVTSAGRIYEFPEGADGEVVLYNTYGTGIGLESEIEGLAYDPIARHLLLLCKNPRSEEIRGTLPVYRWSVDTKTVVEERTVIRTAEIADRLGTRNFQPTGIEVHAGSGHYFLIAARQKAIAEVTAEGEVVAVTKLPDNWHRQAEGITITLDHTLVVADEGAGKRARLTLYPVAGTKE